MKKLTINDLDLDPGLPDPDEAFDGVARTWRHWRDMKDEVDALAKEVNKKIDHWKSKILTWIETTGAEQMNSAGAWFKPTVKYSARINKDDRDAAHLWLRDIGEGDAIQESVHASTLKKLVKQFDEEGIEVPDSIKFSTYTDLKYGRQS